MFRFAPDKPQTEPLAPEAEGDVLPDDYSELEAEPELELPTPAGGGKKLSQPVVMYLGSESGPFQCDHCTHWVGEGQCDVVDGEIDPLGLCHVFEPPQDDPEIEPEAELEPIEGEEIPDEIQPEPV